jgi:hypothetical protein
LSAPGETQMPVKADKQAICSNPECLERLRCLCLALSDKARAALETAIENMTKDKEPLLVLPRPDEPGKYMPVCVDKDSTTRSEPA